MDKLPHFYKNNQIKNAKEKKSNPLSSNKLDLSFIFAVAIVDNSHGYSTKIKKIYVTNSINSRMANFNGNLFH